ncbi:MAG: nucleotide sugar dehydrogenase [archaeon]
MRFSKICIVGMGYVGLTLSVVLAEKGYKVHGMEINKDVAAQLNRGKPHFHENRLDVLLKKHLNNNLTISDDAPDDYEVFIICVGTPLDKGTKKPILDYIMRSAEATAKHLSDGSLVILRSTVPVGITRNVVKPILETAGKKFYLAFCPERTAEGNALRELRELPQVIGGLDQDSVDLAVDLFRKVTPTTIEVSSLEAAEMVKLLNNTYRDLTFAYANEVARICEHAGLSALETIRAANLGYFRSDIPMPGFVGGACLEKDPYILAEYSGKRGYDPKLVRQAREINEALPGHIADTVSRMLSENNVTRAKVFISGFAFKGRPETDDLRGSLTIPLANELQRNHSVFAHDFVVKPEMLELAGYKACSIDDGFRDADCVIIANNHNSYQKLNFGKLLPTMKRPALLYDVWRIFEKDEIAQDGVIYGGVGIG